MAKQAIITVSREQVEADIKRETDKGKSREEATFHVMGHAESGRKEAREAIEILIRDANGHENFDDEQQKEYDRLCRTIIEPETQRIGHCKDIIAELSKPK